MKWIVLLLIVVGIYYLSQNWPSLTSQRSDISPHPPAGESPTTNPPSSNGASFVQGWGHAYTGMQLPGRATPVAESWREETIDGLKLQVPCPLVRIYLDLVPKERFSSNDVLVDLASGDLGNRRIIIGWVAGPSLPAKTNPSWFDDFLKTMAASENWEEMRSNPAANFNGFKG